MAGRRIGVDEVGQELLSFLELLLGPRSLGLEGFQPGSYLPGLPNRAGALCLGRLADSLVCAVVFGSELVDLGDQPSPPRVELGKGVQVDLYAAEFVCLPDPLRVRTQEAQVYRYPLTLCFVPSASAMACCSSIDRLCSESPALTLFA